LLESLIFAKRAALEIGNTYTSLTAEEEKRATHGFDEREYCDEKALAAAYKQAVLDEIEKESKKEEK
jgi:hypothetical protein